MYRDEVGFSPFLNWLHNDESPEVISVVYKYLDFLVTKRGTGIIGSKYLKPLGDHLFQLRIKEYADDQQIKFLIRIYLCFDFRHGVHILSGYNKGLDDSRERQSQEIEKARQLLRKWMETNEAL
jgi:hypothetical protein